jgi:hypothetical protein
VKEREELGSQGAVHPAFVELRECKLIKFYEKVRDAERYDLTLSGLLVALSFQPLWDHINIIIRHHAEKLPLLLGKWSLFIDTKIVDIVIEHMKKYLSYPAKTVHLSPYHLLAGVLKEKNKDARIRAICTL